VDDMIAKNVQDDRNADDLWESFKVLRQYRIKLNPKKCAFRVRSGNFLGYMISSQEIKANPRKVHAILDMRSPRNVKEVQRWIGCIATLGRFMRKVSGQVLTLPSYAPKMRTL